MSVDAVVVDTNAFAYLQALGSLNLLVEIGVRTRCVWTTKAVVKQLHRSGALGPLVQSFCDRGEVKAISPTTKDAVTVEVSRILEGKLGQLVRRNRVDTELVEVSRANNCAVLTCEVGIRRLAAARHVLAVDLVDLFVWAIALRVTDEATIEVSIAPWRTNSKYGTGAPNDFQGTFAGEVAARGGAATILADLPARAAQL